MLDFTNAFNSTSRQAMFEGFRKCLPGLSAWMESCYSGQPLHYMGSEMIHSCCGVQQGDPLCRLRFAVTLQLLHKRTHMHDDVSSLNFNPSYLDDGTLVGSLEDLAAAVRIMELTSPYLGLHLNRGKSLLYIPQGDASPCPLPADIPITHRGFSLLGCPIGPPSYCEEGLQCRISKIRECLAPLHETEDL